MHLYCSKPLETTSYQFLIISLHVTFKCHFIHHQNEIVSSKISVCYFATLLLGGGSVE